MTALDTNILIFEPSSHGRAAESSKEVDDTSGFDPALF